MVDIHTHILPGIDDGAIDIYDTLDMAQMEAESQVHTIVATPHCNIPGMQDNYYNEEYMRLFQAAEEAIRQEDIPVRLCPGMEVFATGDLPELLAAGKILTLNKSCYMLMEFAFDEDPDFADYVLEKVSAVGVKPVIAHAERYDFVQEDPHLVWQWCRKGYLIQINKGSFDGRFGSNAREMAYRLLDHYLVSVIASDAHGSQRRTTYMLDVYEKLKKKYPKRYLEVLFEENPKRICGNQATLRFQPRPFEEH